MKYFLLNILFLLINIPWAMSQNILYEGNRWNISSSGFTPQIYTQALRINGDSVINSIKYKIVQSSLDSNLLQWNNVALIRSDSMNKIWKFENGGNKLLYDFNLKLGDTFEISTIPIHDCELIVEQIDSIALSNGDKRKRIKLNSLNGWVGYQIWIEGIGSEFGLLADHELINCATDYNRYLKCFFIDEELQYTSSNDECWIITSTTEHTSKNKILVYPNPAVGKIKIEATIPITQLKIYNQDGKCILNKEVSNQTGIKLNVNRYKPGIYLLQILNLENEIHTKKVIIK